MLIFVAANVRLRQEILRNLRTIRMHPAAQRARLPKAQYLSGGVLRERVCPIGALIAVLLHAWRALLSSIWLLRIAVAGVEGGVRQRRRLHLSVRRAILATTAGDLHWGDLEVRGLGEGWLRLYLVIGRAGRH
jgi:hypothetical protein